MNTPIHPMPYKDHEATCKHDWHTQENVPCECGLTEDDICGGCGTYECIDGHQCWSWYHAKTNPDHEVGIATCMTCGDGY